MALDLLAIISAAGTGAVTGYLTNNLALKMIFKEYGPLGGVVVKTKDQFIDNISLLLEKDIINHNSLESEFSRPDFKKNFAHSVEDFVNIHLDQRSSGIKLAEISGWDQNYALLSTIFADTSFNLLSRTAENFEDESLERIISKKESKKLLEDIYIKILNKANEDENLEKIASAFYEELKTKSLDQLLNTEIKENLKEISKEAVGYFKKNYQGLNSTEKEKFKEKLKDLFNGHSLSQRFIKEIKKIKINDLFKSEKELQKLKDNKELQAGIEELLVNFKIELDNSDLKVADFISSEMEKKLREELKKLTDFSASEILPALEAESEEINKIIYESIEAEIEASSGFKAMSRQGIYSKYKENIDEYGDPVFHLKEYLKGSISPENDNLLAEIINSIKNIKIDSLLKNVELKTRAGDIEAEIWNFYEANREKRVIKIFPEDFFQQKELEDKIIDTLFSLIKKLSEEEESFELIFSNIFKLKIEDLYDKKSYMTKVRKNSDKIAAFLADNNLFISGTAEYLNNNFFSIVNSELKNNADQFKSKSEEYFKEIKNKVSQKDLRNFYQSLKKEENVVNLTESILDFFYNNLPKLLEGKVSKAAAVNLHQLSDQEVQSAVEEFMGKELKPITYLGALLGAAAGILFSLSGAETALITNAPVWAEYLSSALLYGGVGWLTNVLAIWMIFHPYEKKKLAGIDIPFSPGVVAKNRERFANSMGKFVEKELLRADSASQIIENNREEIKVEVLNYFKEDDYQSLFKLLTKKKDTLAEISTDKITKLLKNSNNEGHDYSDSLISFLNVFFEQKADDFNLKEAVEISLKENDRVAAELKDQLLKNIDVEQLTAAVAAEYNLNFNSLHLKSFLKNKEVYPFFRFVIPYLYEKKGKNDFKKYLLDFLRHNSEDHFQIALDLFAKQEEKAAKIINFKKDEIIEQEKEKEGGLLKNTLMSGALYMADLDEFVDSVVKRVFERLQNDYLPAKKEKIKENYFRILNNIDNSKMLSELEADQLISDFINSKKGANLLTEVLYLSEDEINRLIEKSMSSDSKRLFSAEIELKASEINYFIDEHLGLEEKLQLLLNFKNLFAAENVREEIDLLLEEMEFEAVNREARDFLSGLELLDEEILDYHFIEELNDNLRELLKEVEFKQLFKSEMELQIEKAAELLEADLNRESLDYLLELFIESAIDSFKENSQELLESLELQNLTAEEVRKMNPAEIEQIFDDFAGHYFAHLKQYGWFGGAFGILQLLLRSLV